MLGKKQSFNICKPQVQGVSLSTWGVVRRALCFQLSESSLERINLGEIKGEGGKTKLR